jgi:hypothetical protein
MLQVGSDKVIEGKRKQVLPHHMVEALIRFSASNNRFLEKSFESRLVYPSTPQCDGFLVTIWNPGPRRKTGLATATPVRRSTRGRINQPTDTDATYALTLDWGLWRVDKQAILLYIAF